MTPDKVCREDMDEQLSCAVMERAMDPATADAIRDALADYAKVKAENERLKEELLRLRTPLHLHHRLDETAALAAKDSK